MPYKCEYDEMRACRNCKYTDVYRNSCPRCADTPCPLNEGYTYPRRADWCDQCCFEPKEDSEIYNTANANRDIIVVQKNSIVILRVVPDRAKEHASEWRFFNLTKGHICKCRFATYKDAIKDLEAQKESGKVLDWYYEGENTLK